MKNRNFKSLLLIVGLGLLAAAGWFLLRVEAHELRGIDGVVHGSLENPESKWSVLFFITSDCPIANQYAPEIRRICSAYESRGARCSLVYADASMNAEQVRKHSHDFFNSAYP